MERVGGHVRHGELFLKCSVSIELICMMCLLILEDAKSSSYEIQQRRLSEPSAVIATYLILDQLVPC